MNMTPTQEEFKALCASAPDTIVSILTSQSELIKELHKTIQTLSEQLKALQAQHNQDSHNSSKPPSSDGVKRTIGSTRTKSPRSTGGQQGHKGSTLKMSTTPDKIVTHTVDRCACGRLLKRCAVQRTLRRQVIDIPAPRVEITEHQSEVKCCPCCGATSAAPFPDGIERTSSMVQTLKALL